MTSRVTRLEEDKIPEFTKKWVQTISAPLNKEIVNDVVTQMYKEAGLNKPLIIYNDSPFHLMRTLPTHFQFSRLQLCFQLERLRYQLNSQLQSQLDSRLGPELNFQLDNRLSSSLKTQLRPLYTQLNSLLYQLDSSQPLLTYQLHWCAWYDYWKHIGVEFDETFALFTNFIKEIHFCLAYKEVIFVSQKPIRIHWENRRLHNPNGPAVEYADGWSIYSLNGVPMPKEYVLTPANKIEPETILREENIDVRRELLRRVGRVGVERMFGIGEIIEEQGDYKLVNMARVFNLEYAPFLLMKNPSTGTKHLEGVGPECRTIQQALNWRAGNREIDWLPYQLS